jgi:hypothetical protein
VTYRIAICLSVLCVLFPTTGLTETDGIARYAVVVGVNHAPEASMQVLRFADDDAVQYFNLFRRIAAKVTLLTVMDQETQHRFPDAARESQIPSVENLKRALTTLFARIETDRANGLETELFFVYSGHGRLLPGVEGAITLSDQELTRANLYTMLLEKSPADFNHLIIDACNAYFMVHRRGESPAWQDDSSGRQRNEVAAFFSDQDLSGHPNTGVLLSTTTEAETHEWSRYQGGIFSHEVRSALLGAADASQDGYIEYTEVEAFIRAANHRIDDPGAKLDVYARPPARDRHRALVDLPTFRQSGLLDIPRSERGRFYLENEQGTRITDFNTSGEVGVTITIPANETHFLRNLDRETEFEVTITADARVRLGTFQAQPLSTASKGAVEKSFHGTCLVNRLDRPFTRGWPKAGACCRPSTSNGRPGAHTIPDPTSR